MRVRELHPWDVTYKEAADIQNRLRVMLTLRKPRGKIRTVAGADVYYEKRGNTLYAGVRVFSFPELDPIDESTAVGTATFPYVPGLLSFREAPVLLEAFRHLATEPEVIIFDAQGIAHPRRLGLACHVGLVLDRPSVGCAKSRLVGEHDDVGERAGDLSHLRHEGKIVGAVLRTRSRVRPVFVSAGHRMNLTSSVAIVERTCRGYRLPEPTRQAHLLVNQLRRGERRAERREGAELDFWG